MPSSDLLLPFFLASMVFACVPGPGMFYAAAQTMALGRRAGWWSALGFHVAGLGHIGAAAVGASALLHTMPRLFLVMQILGAAYLIWMGIGYLRARTDRLTTTSNAANDRSTRKALFDSVLVEILNPKSALFHFIFLPQFTDPSAAFPLWLQIVILGMIVNVMFTMTDLVLIEVSHAMVRYAKRSTRRAVAIQRSGGVILVMLGIKLALDGP